MNYTAAEIEEKENHSTIKSEKEIARNWMLKELGFYIERWTITPSMAKDILNDMGLNRKIKAGRITKYSSIMRKGLWELSPQGIIFDENGKLIDGQHRLESVIFADKPMDFIVFIDVPHDTPIDVGLSRTPYDSLMVRGNIPENLSSGEIFSIANAIFAVTLKSTDFKKITDEEKGAFVLHYSEEITFAKNVSCKGSHAPIAKKAGIRAAICCAAICGISRDTLEEFSEVVNSGRWQKECQRPALVLRGMIEDQKITGRGNGGGNDISKLESFTEEAIRDYTEGKPRRKKYKGVEHPYSSKIDVKKAIEFQEGQRDEKN